jgi:hypothetical protein
MSSGHTIPYHLRQNKAIDRNLFVDLLSRVGRFRNISEYRYIGFGGPFLEDFKVLHGALRISKMISLDGDGEVVKRQEFNQPISCVELIPELSGDFLRHHEFLDPSVVWFDYTMPKSLGLQLAEIELLTRKSNPGDIIRVTLNASPEALGKPDSAADTDLKEYRLSVAQDRMAEYCPANASEDDVSAAKYPNLLLKCVESALKKGMDTKRTSVIEPLSAFVYADGQQMLTVTAIVLQKIDLDPFYQATRLKSWAYRCIDWSPPRSISVPQLSAKERMFIEGLLPGESDPAAISSKLGYMIGDNPKEAEQLLSNFLQYYRLFPWYSRVVL